MPVVVDVMDADGLMAAVGAAGPEIVIHQLTDLPPGLDPARMAASRISNARLRDEGTRNLVAAARAAGVRRLIAQSIAWVYATGPQPYSESSPLDVGMTGEGAISMRGVEALESHVLGAAPLEGVVLRYGRLYGPGTGFDTPPQSLPLHVDAAAYAAFLAMERGGPGIFNVAEPTGEVAIGKATAELGWSPSFRLPPDLSEGTAAA
jgi:nucleoside-diphosphate-sugar epimerase